MPEIGSIPWWLAPDAASIGHLDVQDRRASFALSTTPAVLVFPTVVNTVGAGFEYNSTTGVITLTRTGVYWHNMLLNAHTTANRIIYAAAEIDTGSGFVPSRYSARECNVTGNTDGQVIFISNNQFVGQQYPGGVKLRFLVWASGACNLESTDVPGVAAGTLTVPAARLMYSCIAGA